MKHVTLSLTFLTVVGLTLSFRKNPEPALSTAIASKTTDPGFVDIFNGVDFTGWAHS